MRGLFLMGPESVGVREMDDPQIRGDEVLVRVKACGICGGDIKRYRLSRGPSEFPQFLGGHEFSGEVVEVGGDVEGFEAGDRVANCFANYCGFCLHCRLGRENFCIGLGRRQYNSGGFAERTTCYVPSKGRGLHKIPEGIDYKQAALAEPGTCAVHAALKANASPGDFVAVLGLGGLGQMIAQILASQRARVIGIDIQADKCRIASKFCENVIDASKDEPIGVAREITGGVGPDIVLEVVGVEETLTQAVEMIRLGGRLVLVGVFVKPTTNFNPERFFRKDIQVVPSKGPYPHVTPRGVPTVFDYIQRGIIRPSELIATFPFEGGEEAFRAQAEGGVPKAVVVYD
ncbi:MAG: zinc-dependent alcohol dehydrogenase [bacterium]